jgi:hypothetical protein
VVTGDNSKLLDKLTELIASGKRPDLKDLAAAVRHDIKEVDVISWEGFSETVRNSYGIDEDEFYQLMLPPMFNRKGGYTDDFLPLLDKIELRGWLRRYVDHTMFFESPTAFHFAPALAVLATALKRQVYINQGIYKVWPAVAVFLVGPSGRTHKSTASNYAIHIGEMSGRTNRLMDEGSQEALKRQLNGVTEKTGQTVGILYASEFSTLIGKAEYHQTIVPALIDLFDARDKMTRLTNTQGDVKLKDIAISAIFCSNEELAASAMPASAFGGGLMSRILVWFQSDTNRRSALPLEHIDPDKLERGKRQLIEMLAKTGVIMGEVTLTPQAKEWFTARYDYICDNRPEDQRLDPLWSRYGDWLMRLAMLIRVSDMLEDAYEKNVPLVKAPLEITIREFKQADAILRWVLRYLPKVYAFLGLTPFGVEATRIMQFIARRNGRATEKEIGRKLKISKRQLDEQLETLLHYGYISVYPGNVGGPEYQLERDPFEV